LLCNLRPVPRYPRPVTRGSDEPGQLLGSTGEPPAECRVGRTPGRELRRREVLCRADHGFHWVCGMIAATSRWPDRGGVAGRCAAAFSSPGVSPSNAAGLPWAGLPAGPWRRGGMPIGIPRGGRGQTRRFSACAWVPVRSALIPRKCKLDDALAIEEGKHKRAMGSGRRPPWSRSRRCEPQIA
jgi:hypothetical protein